MAKSDFIQIEGLEQLKKNLQGLLPREVNKAARNAVTACANEIRDDMRNNMPAHLVHYRSKIATYRPRLTRSGGAAAHVVAKRTKPKPFYLANIYEHSKGQPRKTKAGKNRGRVAATPFAAPAAERYRQKMPQAFEKHFSDKVADAWEARKTDA